MRPRKPAWLSIQPLIVATLAFFSPANAQTQIYFDAGSDSGIWSGYVSGSKSFALKMNRHQRLWIFSDSIYTWSVNTPSGRSLGCKESDHCAPNDDEGILLPETGVYIVRTDYRMGGGADVKPLAKRYVVVTFFVR